MRSRIYGVIYDLDGTIISTEALHDAAWKSAAERCQMVLTPQMLIDHKGRPEREFAEEVLSGNRREDVDGFVREKQRYVREHLGEIDFCPGFLDAQEALGSAEICTWICTAGEREFVDQCFYFLPELGRFQDRVVSCDMYEHGKPSAEPLLLTLRLMGGLNAEDAVYVGDAYSDYLAAGNAQMRFIYFRAEGSHRDTRIPKSISVIQHHQEILGLIE